MRRQDGRAGTSLIEALIAIGVLTGAVMLLASLTALAVRTSTRARERTLAAFLAVQKLESLAAAARDLPLSPPGALVSDVPGCVDFADAFGRRSESAAGAVFVRRWSITAVGGDADLLAITVEAAPCRRRFLAPACGDADARVRLTTVRSRLLR